MSTILNAFCDIFSKKIKNIAIITKTLYNFDMFNIKIREERRKSKLTQQELSKLLNISQSTLAGYETGVREPSIDILIKLTKIFNCSLDYLVGNASSNCIIETATNEEKEIFLLIKKLSDIEQTKTKAYIQGLLDNRVNQPYNSYNNNSFNNSIINSKNNNINF